MTFTSLIQAHSKGLKLQRNLNGTWCNITLHQMEEAYQEGAPAHQFRAIPTNEARYLWLAAYLVSDRQDADNAIVGASTIDELSSVIDKEMLK